MDELRHTVHLLDLVKDPVRVTHRLHRHRAFWLAAGQECRQDPGFMEDLAFPFHPTLFVLHHRVPIPIVNIKGDILNGASSFSPLLGRVSCPRGALS
ncbi:MAG: hypothetical protein QXI12_08005 [Candidatus Methanomethyliaceae archaeon]